MSSEVEGKRDRVRRLLIDPLTELGFRKPARVKTEGHEAGLTKLADDLAYMSDANLSALFDMMKSKGDGKERCLWPPRAAFLKTAEHIQPRPIEELPSLLRWFRSVEGPKARANGTLVETLEYFQTHKRPPINARSAILSRAQDNQRQRELFQDRVNRGVARPEEVEWLRVYEAKRQRCDRIVQEGEQARA
jgi:hypothetical protein